MRRVSNLALSALFVFVPSCAFLLDFDELAEGGPAPVAGAAGTSGAAGVAGAGAVPVAGAASGAAGMAGAAGAAGVAGAAAAGGMGLEEVPAALASALCGNLTACYGPLVELFIHDEDCATLFSSVIREQTVAPIAASVAEGTLGFDRVQAAECVRRIVASTAQTPPVCHNPNEILEGCKVALDGLSGAGLPCRHAFECARGHYCDLAACPGVCRAFGAPSATCTRNEECDPTQGLYCQLTATGAAGAGGAAGGPAGTTGHCEHFIPAGEACVPNQDECEPGSLCMSGSCVRVDALFTLGTGLPCFWNVNGLLCEPGLSCEFQGALLLSQATCAAEKSLLDPCKLAFPGECPSGSYCTADFGGNNGQCAVTPGENQTCAAATEQSAGLSAACQAGLTCVNGICKAMRHLDEPCEIPAQCYSGACLPPPEGGTPVCVPPSCPVEATP